MKRILNKIVIIDVESTCWEVTPPIGMESEIIEIGVCLLDINTGEITDNRGIFVLPELSSIDPFLAALHYGTLLLNTYSYLKYMLTAPIG